MKNKVKNITKYSLKLWIENQISGLDDEPRSSFCWIKYRHKPTLKLIASGFAERPTPKTLNYGPTPKPKPE